MSVKATNQTRSTSPTFDDFDNTAVASPKLDKAEMQKRVLAILRAPSTVNAKELVQRATYGALDPFDTFDPVDFQSKIKK